jgi:hypothetical protein
MEKVTKHLTLNLWVHAHPADDAADQWVAHCLDLDVVSQGDNLAHALQMVAEASAMVVAEDMKRGAEPLARRAPDECWDAVQKLTATPSLRPLSRQEIATLDPKAEVEVVANVVMTVRVDISATVGPSSSRRQSEDSLMLAFKRSRRPEQAAAPC